MIFWGFLAIKRVKIAAFLLEKASFSGYNMLCSLPSDCEKTLNLIATGCTAYIVCALNGEYGENP